MTLLVAVLYIVDRLMSQTADENIPSSVGMFHSCILLSCSFVLLYLRCILYSFLPLFYIYHQVHQVVVHWRSYSQQSVSLDDIHSEVMSVCRPTLDALPTLDGMFFCHTQTVYSRLLATSMSNNKSFKTCSCILTSLSTLLRVRSPVYYNLMYLMVYIK